jgi:hypothetical protein
MFIRAVMAGVILFLILLAVYLLLDRYLRWDTRRRMEARHRAGEGDALSREDFVERGLAEYERSNEKRLLLGIFILPFAVIGLLALFVN